MKLLIISQKVDKNDPVLGFFHKWIEEFAKNCESLVVICLGKGEYSLPHNVKVLSLGKEEGKSKLTYILRFYKYIWQERKNYDAVFVHMNPVYVVLGNPIWKLLNKKIILWYVHRRVNLILRIAEKLVNVLLTSSKESFNIESSKVRYMWHGIDTDIFAPANRDQKSQTLISVGRITPIKNCHVLLNALSLLLKKDSNWKVVLIGDPVTNLDIEYKKQLERMVRENNLTSHVQFIGSMTSMEIKNNFSKAFASVNMTPTGGMDKVVFESLAVGCPVFTSNNAFRNLFNSSSSFFIFKFGHHEDLAQKIDSWKISKNKGEIITPLSNKVITEYSISKLVEKICKILNG